MTAASPPTIETQLREALPVLSPTGRKLADYVLAHYPVAALGSIHALSKAADVSSPTVLRLVQRLGFRGYPDFQASLRTEVEGMLASPIAKYDKWADAGPEGDLLNRFAEQALGNMQATLAGIDRQEFDAIAALIGDPQRRIYALGGRVTHSLAAYFTTLAKVVRADVELLTGEPSTWPPTLMEMRAGDVLLIFDIRRYENSVLRLAELAAELDVRIVLITDRWRSPVARLASHVLACHVEAPSAWDSTISILLLIEALLAGVQNLHWQETEARLQRLETLYARTDVFRRLR